MVGRMERLALDEQGSETVEVMFVLPVLLVVFLAIVQFCLWGYWAMALNGQLEHGTWNVTASELSQIQSGSAQGEELIKDRVANGTNLDKDLMDVSDVRVTSDSSSRLEATRSSDAAAYGITAMARDTSTKHIEAKVTYRCPKVLSIAPEITIERSIDHTVIESDRIEVR